MLNFIKQRLGKNVPRLFLHDKELIGTVFKPGTHYRYLVDIVNKKMIILPADEGNTVSVREVRNGNAIPLIDIRRKSAFSAFEGCEYLQITIFNDRVTVQGFVHDETAETVKADELQQDIKVESNVRDIRQLLSVRQTAKVVMSVKELQQAVGSEYRFVDSLFDEAAYHPQSSMVRTALKQTKIPLKVLSLFSGAGLMDLGFINEGFDIVKAVEINHWASETYRRNLGNHVECKDVLNFKEIPEVPIIIGGLLCQGLSNANRLTNYLNNPKNWLVKEFIRVVQSNPATKVFLIENVPQFLTAGDDGVFLREIEQVLGDFEITSGVLTATDYGSAQARKRAFVIGSKIGRIELPPAIRSAARTVRDAFSGLHNRIANQLDFTKAKESTVARMEQITEGGNWRDVPELMDSDHHSSYLRRLKWDEPSITLPNIRKAMLLHPEENRILSVREAARLFDVPDDFVFYGPLSEKQQMVGNGVPVTMAQALARQIRLAFGAVKSNVVPFLKKSSQLAFEF